MSESSTNHGMRPCVFQRGVTAREDEFYATKAWSKVMGGSSSFNDPMREFDGLHLSDSI